MYLAPALRAIAYETDKPDAPGLDYAGLQIGHLGAIYEALLTLRLTRAPEDLAYDSRRDIFRPSLLERSRRSTKAQIYYQAEAGGRKAGGVFYTRHEFVDHLLQPLADPQRLKTILQRSRKYQAATQMRQRGGFSISQWWIRRWAVPISSRLLLQRWPIDLTCSWQKLGVACDSQQFSELVHERESSAHPPEATDLLRRLILKRCIFGVDISPMAVEVANVTLWLDSFVPGLALSYLGSNLKCGDALIGVADPSVVGASDSPMFTGQAVVEAMTRAADIQRKLADNPDRTPEEVKRSEELSADLHRATRGLRAAFDLWGSEPLGLDGARHTWKYTRMQSSNQTRARPPK